MDASRSQQTAHKQAVSYSKLITSQMQGIEIRSDEEETEQEQILLPDSFLRLVRSSSQDDFRARRTRREAFLALKFVTRDKTFGQIEYDRFKVPANVNLCSFCFVGFDDKDTDRREVEAVCGHNVCAKCLKSNSDKNCSNCERFSVDRKEPLPPIKINAFEIKWLFNDISDSRRKFDQKKFWFDEKINSTLKNRFKIDSFRPGQLAIISAMIQSRNVFVLMASGGGKSLTYQLPAVLCTGFFLVISPIISLMHDQIRQLKDIGVGAVAIDSKNFKNVIADLKFGGRIKLVYMSPERLMKDEVREEFRKLSANGRVARIVFDEAHCIYQWGIDFRSAYLFMDQVLNKVFTGIPVALYSASVTPHQRVRILQIIGMDDQTKYQFYYFLSSFDRSNLHYRLERIGANDEKKNRRILEICQSWQFKDCSGLIYCNTKTECEKVAEFLLIRDITAAPFHADIREETKQLYQKKWTNNQIRIMVCTVAFGLGINKPDVRFVIHYNMPKTFESYIQEIGRAGRDGLPARCHLFLGTEGKDLSELKRHIFSNSIDRHTLRKLLHLIFEVSDESENSTIDYKEVALSVDSTIEALDMPEENISTLLCYLESSSFSETEKVPWVRLQNPVYSTCRIQCYGGPIQLRSAASSNPPLAAAIALQRQKGVDFSGASSLEFPVVDVSSRMGWNSGVVKKELKNLEWKSTPSGWKKTGIIVEFSNLAFHFDALQGLAEKQIDKLQNDIFERSRNQEFSELSNLLRLHRAFTLVSFKSQTDATDLVLNERSNKLKEYIASYFSDPEKILDEVKTVPEHCEEEPDIRNSVRAFVGSHVDHTWNGRAVARIFHGIQSPNFPAKQWGRVYKYWRSNLHIDFNILVKIASEEVLRMRTGD